MTTIPIHGLATLSDLRYVVYWAGGSALCSCPRYDSHPCHTPSCSAVWRNALQLALAALAGTQERTDLLTMCDRLRRAPLTESTFGLVLRCAGDSVRQHLWQVATSRVAREEARLGAEHLLNVAFGPGTYCACEEPDGSSCLSWVEWHPERGDCPDVCPSHLGELLSQSTASLPECPECGAARLPEDEWEGCYTCDIHGGYPAHE